MRQCMVDVEQVLNLLEANDQIMEIPDPVPLKINGGQIKFEKVRFTYDSKLPKEE
jgi:ABC-type transport system involved in Fe-S cluster assembly fused permease/ATPase subunit